MSLRKLILGLVVVVSPLVAMADGYEEEEQVPQEQEQEVEQQQQQNTQSQSQSQNVTVDVDVFIPDQNYYCQGYGCPQPMLPYPGPQLVPVPVPYPIPVYPPRVFVPIRPYLPRALPWPGTYPRYPYHCRHGYRRYCRISNETCTVKEVSRNTFQVIAPEKIKGLNVLFEGVRENANYMLKYYKQNGICPADYSNLPSKSFDI